MQVTTVTLFYIRRLLCKPQCTSRSRQLLWFESFRLFSGDAVWKSAQDDDICILPGGKTVRMTILLNKLYVRRVRGVQIRDVNVDTIKKTNGKLLQKHLICMTEIKIIHKTSMDHNILCITSCKLYKIVSVIS